MKMKKAGIVLALLMISGIFAGGIALATHGEDFPSDAVKKVKGYARYIVTISDTDKSVPVSDIVGNDIDVNDIQDAINDVTSNGKFRKVGFARAIKGVGSMNNGVSGHLINLVWVKQNFVDADADASDIGRQSDKTRAVGRLKIVGGDNLKLVRYSGDEDSVKFYIVSPQVKANVANAERSNLGTLTLEKIESYKGLDKWEGSLIYNNDGPNSSWKVEIATRTKVLRPDAGFVPSINGGPAVPEPLPSEDEIGVATETEVDTDRRGFFKRFRAFFARNSGPTIQGSN
ncbi:MAG: hypothetical protein IIA87_03765 [Nanoarchaeota archaeon]|nr:hypothetical protein [Nanoarchaeota archaeon]